MPGFGSGGGEITQLRYLFPGMLALSLILVSFAEELQLRLCCQASA